jgi:hypothetical protein
MQNSCPQDRLDELSEAGVFADGLEVVKWYPED